MGPHLPEKCGQQNTAGLDYAPSTQDYPGGGQLAVIVPVIASNRFRSALG